MKVMCNFGSLKDVMEEIEALAVFPNNNGFGLNGDIALEYRRTICLELTKTLETFGDIVRAI